MSWTTNGGGPAYSVNGSSSGGSITAADITDSTTVGRAVLTATDAAAARTAIGPDATALPVAAVADWRLWTLAQGDTTIVNAANAGTYDLTANANAAAALGATSTRGGCFAAMNLADDAIADRKSIAGASGLLPTAMSVAAWFVLERIPPRECFVWMKRNDDTDWNAGVTGVLIDATTGKLKIQNGVSQVTLAEYVPIGVPQLVVFTRSGSTAKTYLGGRLISTDTFAWSAPTSGSWGLFGQSAAGTAATFSQGLSGTGDRVVVWDSVLTAAQIRTLADLTRWPWST